MSIEQIQKNIGPILKQYQVKKAALFGSIVTGNFHENSDIDILIEMPKDVSLFDVLKVKVTLEEKLNRKVDLIQYKAIKPKLKNSILKDQISLSF